MRTTVDIGQIDCDQKHLVPASTELILLNNRWQRKIRDEKERRRNASMMIGIDNEHIELNDVDDNQPVPLIDNILSSNFNTTDESLNFEYVVSVTKVSVPVENTREHIAQQYTLNKNQKAAFMIITGHLDGLDRLNEGEIMLFGK